MQSFAFTDTCNECITAKVKKYISNLISMISQTYICCIASNIMVHIEIRNYVISYKHALDRADVNLWIESACLISVVKEFYNMDVQNMSDS